MTKPTAQIILANLANYKLKLEDAPCSAESHFDYAIYILSELCADWNPSDQEIIQTIRDSREHMAFYHKQAKKIWPKHD